MGGLGFLAGRHCDPADRTTWGNPGARSPTRQSPVDPSLLLLCAQVCRHTGCACVSVWTGRQGPECMDGHGESQCVAVEGAESLHRGVWGPCGDPAPSCPRHGHSHTAAKTQRWRGLAERPAHLTEREAETVQVPQPLKAPCLQGCLSWTGQGLPACSLWLRCWAWVWGRSAVGVVRVLERRGRHWTPTPCPSRKPPPRSPLGALGFGAICGPERVAPLSGADGKAAGVPSPCPPPRGPWPAVSTPRPSRSPVPALVPRTAGERGGCYLYPRQKGPVAPRPGVGAWEGAKRKPEPVTPVRGQAGRPQRRHPGPQPLPGRSVPDPGGGQPWGACSRFRGWGEGGRGGGRGGPGRPCPLSA